MAEQLYNLGKKLGQIVDRTYHKNISPKNLYRKTQEWTFTKVILDYCASKDVDTVKLHYRGDKNEKVYELPLVTVMREGRLYEKGGEFRVGVHREKWEESKNE